MRSYLTSLWIVQGVLTGVILLLLSGCTSDGGSKPTGFGAVTGVVRLPFGIAASGAPVVGAQVRVTGGDFDTTTATDTSGTYLIDDVPARTVTVSASLGDCLSGSQSNVAVRKADTITVDVTLDSRAEFDTIPLPGSGAVRMEIMPEGGRAVLLYDSAGAAPGHPSVVTVDLATGATMELEFPDIAEAYDLRLAGDNIAVFNFRSSAGFGLRFVSLAGLAAAGSDVLYTTNPSGFAGHLALDDFLQHVFVAHAIQLGPSFVGKVYAVSVGERKVLDADDDSTDGNAAFDTLLIRQSLGWAYNVAYDDVRHEVLVGNRTTGFVTAIEWAKWGTFDRSAHLSLPTPGVRKVNLDTQLSPFQVWFFGFAGGIGIGAYPQNSGMVRFQSGSDAGDVSHTDPSVNMRSDAHFLTIVPSRQSWFTLLEDLTEWDTSKMQTAVEERSWSTLHRLYRFESHHFVLPDRGIPRAFAVDATNKRLYVAYRNRPMMEVFCLP